MMATVGWLLLCLLVFFVGGVFGYCARTQRERDELFRDAGLTVWCSRVDADGKRTPVELPVRVVRVEHLARLEARIRWCQDHHEAVPPSACLSREVRERFNVGAKPKPRART